jgi:hypothetical protein
MARVVESKVGQGCKVKVMRDDDLVFDWYPITSWSGFTYSEGDTGLKRTKYVPWMKEG